MFLNRIVSKTIMNNMRHLNKNNVQKMSTNTHNACNSYKLKHFITVGYIAGGVFTSVSTFSYLMYDYHRDIHQSGNKPLIESRIAHPLMAFGFSCVFGACWPLVVVSLATDDFFAFVVKKLN